MFQKFVIILGLYVFGGLAQTDANFKELETENYSTATGLYNIEGFVLPPDPKLGVGSQWPADLTLSINSGEYLGFVRQDGSFVISGVPSGSYVLYAHHADIFIQPIRLEIAQSGKFRARRLSNIKPSLVIKVPYPLVMKPLARRKYFRSREQWNIIDYMLNPMVLIMVGPLILMLILPRLINDPETKREIDNIQFPKIPNGVPDLSDLLTSLIHGKRPADKEKEKKPIANKKPKSPLSLSSRI